MSYSLRNWPILKGKAMKGRIVVQKKEKGFSLIELLVVIAIILVIIALLLPMTLRLDD